MISRGGLLYKGDPPYTTVATILATMSVRVSVLVSVFLQKNLLMVMDQACKFSEQTSRIPEFRPKGLEN